PPIHPDESVLTSVSAGHEAERAGARERDLRRSAESKRRGGDTWLNRLRDASDGERCSVQRGGEQRPLMRVDQGSGRLHPSSGPTREEHGPPTRRKILHDDRGAVPLLPPRAQGEKQRTSSPAPRA